MTLDSIQFTEIIAQSKRDELERTVERRRMLSQIDVPATGMHPRRAIASALMRLATIIDANAGSRAAAAAH
jgi:hypothetical protein